MKQAVWMGMIVGSMVGEFIPSLWGAGMFSFSSIFLGAAGGIVGIYIAYKLAQ